MTKISDFIDKFVMVLGIFSSGFLIGDLGINGLPASLFLLLLSLLIPNLKNETK